MPSTIYADGFSQVHFTGGMVRMDAYVLGFREGQNPAAEEGCRIVMTPQAFVDALGAMQQLAARLAEAGILQPAPQGRQ